LVDDAPLFASSTTSFAGRSVARGRPSRSRRRPHPPAPPIDGVVQVSEFGQRTCQRRVRLKVLSKLDVAERRRPQDGRFSISTTTGKIDRSARHHSCRSRVKELFCGSWKAAPS
jgi:hypothetical protein